jgi:hypothetical protein
MYGSASGFFNIAWKTAPEIDNPPPTTIASNTLGNRISKNTLFIISESSLLVKDEKSKESVIFVSPINNEAIAEQKSKIKSIEQIQTVLFKVTGL